MNKPSFVPAGLVISAFFAFMLVFAPVAHAQYDDYGYDGGCCDFGGYDYSGDYGYDYTPDYSYGYTPDYSYDYTPDYSSGYDYTPDYSSDYSYAPDSYDYGGYDYGSLGLSGSLGLGYSPSYSSGYGGYSYPYTSYYPVSTPSHFSSYNSSTYAPTTVTTNTNTNTNTNNNSCTSGSCNIAINNSTPIVQQSTPTIIYAPQQPVYTPPVYTPPTYVPPPVYNYTPTCQIQAYPSVISYGQAATLSWSSNYASSGFITYVGNVGPTGQTSVTPAQTMTYVGTFTGQNGQQATCSATVSVQSYPVVYNHPPTVTLSAVPYTGLDLGAWGEAAYWGFLALMVLLAAYLLVVKRVQNGMASKMSLFFFGNEEKEDAFLRSQIHRS